MKLLNWSRETFLSILVVFLGVQVFVLSLRVRSLAHRVEEVAATGGRSPRQHLISVGDRLESVAARNVSSRAEVTLPFQTRRTVFFVISPQCGACTASVPHFASIARASRPYATVCAISGAPLESLQKYAAEHGRVFCLASLVD
jgi:hypothetical protein